MRLTVRTYGQPARLYFLPLRATATRPATAIPTRAIEPGSGTLNAGAADATPQVDTNAMTVAQKDWLRDFMESTPLTLVAVVFISAIPSQSGDADWANANSS